MRFESLTAQGKQKPGSKGAASARAMAFILCCAVLMLVLALFGSTPRIAAADDGSKQTVGQGPAQATQTAEAAGTMAAVPTPTPTRWESAALSELADELGWQPLVGEDGGKLSISLT